MNQIELSRADDNPQVNERLWQAWVCKNRELDRRGTLMRVRMLKVVVGIVIVAAVLRDLIK